MPAKSQPGPPARGPSVGWREEGTPSNVRCGATSTRYTSQSSSKDGGAGGASRANTPRAAPSTSRQAEKDRIWKILISKISEVRLVLGDPCFVKKSGFGQAAKRDLKQPTSSALRTGGSHGAECSPE